MLSLAADSNYMDVRILYLKKIILADLKTQYTVSKLAKHINVSPSYLQTLFKRSTNVSPIQFILNLRLEKSKELLETTFLQVKEICNEVGYTDQCNFTRDFKKKFGYRPTDYRQQIWLEKLTSC